MFTPQKIGARMSPNRFMASSVWLALADEETHAPTQALVHHYKELARGHVGVILCEHTTVDSEFGYAGPRQLALDNDGLIEAHSKMVEDVVSAGKEAGNDVLFLSQVAHAGANGTSDRRFIPAEGVVPAGPHSAELIVPTDDEIKEKIIQKFVDASIRAAKANYHGIELHFAHGYLVSSFLNPTKNTRPTTSRYRGDTLEGRSQLPIDIISAVREALKEEYPDFIVGFKISSSDFQESGNTYQDVVDMMDIITSKVNVDFIELSGGSPWAENGCTPIRKGKFQGKDEEVWYRESAELIKKQMPNRTKIAIVGGLRSKDICNELIESELVDFISFGRPLVCEPDLPLKFKNNEEDTASVCSGCMACIVSAMRAKPKGALSCPKRAELNKPIDNLF